jgi:hypothetical protein
MDRNAELLGALYQIVVFSHGISPARLWCSIVIPSVGE